MLALKSGWYSANTM